MRYALTYQADDGWSSVDTIIVDDRSGGYCWFDDNEKLKEMLESYGVESEWADRVVDGGNYYVRELTNTDITLGINGEIL